MSRKELSALRVKRLERGLTLEFVSKHVGVSIWRLSRIERGLETRAWERDSLKDFYEAYDDGEIRS